MQSFKGFVESKEANRIWVVLVTFKAYIYTYVYIYVNKYIRNAMKLKVLTL